MPVKKLKKKVKKVAPRIRVEEVEEPKISVAPQAEEQVKLQPETQVEVNVPKVSSFSQLDSSTSLNVEEETSKETDVSAEVPADENSKPQSTIENKEEDMSSDDVKEWLKDIRPDTTKEVEKSSSGFNGKLFFSLLIVFIMLGALAGGLFYYKQRVSPQESNTNKKPEEVSSAPTMTPTPEAKVDLTKYTVNVLNGSGTPGEAGVVKGLIIAKGFDETKIKTANASSYTYKNTEVQVKVDVPTSVTDAIIKSLEDKYTVEINKENLANTSSYDIVIIVGDQK